MKNADMPAMPVMDSNGQPMTAKHRLLDGVAATGFTKREMMAMHMMCSMNSSPTDKFRFNSATSTAEWAVKSADILLAELERTKGEPK
ncbi:MAG: hypothetical protein ACRC8G_09000 [Plesiomonas shigelloides]